MVQKCIAALPPRALRINTLQINILSVYSLFYCPFAWQYLRQFPEIQG